MAERQRTSVPPECGHSLTDELLELLWTLRERGADPVSWDDPEEALRDEECHGQDQEDLHGRMRETIDEAERSGWVERRDGRVELTASGDERGRGLLRRHRLAEQLFCVVLEVAGEVGETHACRLEHFLSPEVTDSVCAFLGHPRHCIHGRPIPPGPCCERPDSEVGPLVMPLTRLPAGASARVVFISSKRHAHVDRLAALGVVPGVVIRLHQRMPAYVLAVGETTLALDADIAGEVYVRRVDGT